VHTTFKAMDATSSADCFLSQRATGHQSSPKSWASSSPVCTYDQVWLEELIGLSSNKSFPSQPSSPSILSSSPGGSRSSSEGTGSLHSWNSGVTCLLHSSIKKQSQEAFQTRLREERGWGKLAACNSRSPRCRTHPQAEWGGGSHYKELQQRRGSGQISIKSVKLQWVLEERIKAKLKFSQFLDEVTSNVLDPNSLQAFGKTVSPSGSVTTNPDQPEDQIQVVRLRLPCSITKQHSLLPEPKTPEEETSPDLPRKTYLETDIDSIRWNDELLDLAIKAETPLQLEIVEKHVIPPPPQFCQGYKIPFPEFCCDFPRYPHRSASLPRGINMVSDESHPSL